MMSRKRLTVTAVALAAAAIPYVAMASLGNGGLNYDFGDGIHANARLTLSYGMQIRTKHPDAGLAAGSDGDSNFQAGDLTSNNIQGLLQANISKGQSGLVFSGTDFYDFAYRSSRFPKYARYYDGSYPRVLDAYGYTSFDTGGGTLLTLKLGNQVVNWGEMNFFPDMAGAQGPFDAIKGDMPGAQTQAILLPERQLSATFAVNDKLTLLADYQFGFHATQLAPVGSYFSTSNESGPGVLFLPMLAPDGTPLGVRSTSANGDATNMPTEWGQFGIGARYQATRATTVGVYYLQYDDRTTLPDFATGMMVNLAHENLVGLTTNSLLVMPSWVPVWVGSMAVSTETTYRWNGTVLTTAFGIPERRGHYLTSGVDVLDNLGNTPLSPLTTLLFEVSGQYLGGIPTHELFYNTRTAGAAHIELSLDYPGILPGWELVVPFDYAYQFNGRTLFGPSVASGSGEHAGVYSVAANATWHQNLTFGLSYQGYTGGFDARAESAHPVVDRDFAAFTVTYTF